MPGYVYKMSKCELPKVKSSDKLAINMSELTRICLKDRPSCHRRDNFEYFGVHELPKIVTSPIMEQVFVVRQRAQSFAARSGLAFPFSFGFRD